MKPLSFKVKFLSETDSGWTKRDGEKVYKLYPEDDPLKHADNAHFITASTWFTRLNIDGSGNMRLDVNMYGPLQGFLVPSEYYETFKRIVHNYNLRYCDVPDVKVLDGLIEYCKERLERWEGTKEVQNQYV